MNPPGFLGLGKAAGQIRALATFGHLLSIIVRCLSLDSTDPNHICASFLALAITSMKNSKSSKKEPCLTRSSHFLDPSNTLVQMSAASVSFFLISARFSSSTLTALFIWGILEVMIGITWSRSQWLVSGFHAPLGCGPTCSLM